MHFMSEMNVCIFIHSGFEIQTFKTQIHLLECELFVVLNFEIRIISIFEIQNFSLSFRISGI